MLSFFMIQLSHRYMTTGKTVALTVYTFVSKVMSLLFNTLSIFVVVFLPKKEKCVDFITAVTVRSDFGVQENKICHSSHFPPSICHEMMGPDDMISIFWMLNSKPTFSLPSFTFIQRLCRYRSLLIIPPVSTVPLHPCNHMTDILQMFIKSCHFCA